MWYCFSGLSGDDFCNSPHNSDKEYPTKDTREILVGHLSKSQLYWLWLTGGHGAGEGGGNIWGCCSGDTALIDRVTIWVRHDPCQARRFTAETLTSSE